jgi:hypothetical protein
MVEHRNVANFFTGMDQRIGPQPGVWLAVTSISFDISVLELFWTLARGFKVVIQEEGDKNALSKQPQRSRSPRKIDFSLFYFAADAGEVGQNRYRLLLEGAKYADRNGFLAVWTPERHFHAFGGLYPNPSLTSAAIAGGHRADPHPRRQRGAAAAQPHPRRRGVVGGRQPVERPDRPLLRLGLARQRLRADARELPGAQGGDGPRDRHHQEAVGG